MGIQYIPGSGFQSLSVERGFWILIVRGIPDSLSCIPDSKAQDSKFYKQKFPGFRNHSLHGATRELSKDVFASDAGQPEVDFWHS